MKRVSVALVALLFLGVFPTLAHNNMSNSKRLKVVHIADELAINKLNSDVRDKAQDVVITRYWSGVAAPATRQFKVRLLWSDTALYVRFVASQDEPLIVSDKPDLTQKIKGLWDRDVCEIFIAPRASQRNKYFEFEIAPTGEWIDLGIEVTPKARKTDWEYKSGMTSSAKIEKDRVVMAIKIPFASLGRTPKVGDIWLGNLFRCIGKDPTRGYLAWQPTKTNEPAFHVPKAFGEFQFVK